MTLMSRTSYSSLNDFFEDFWDNSGLSHNRPKMSMPAVNICETADQFRIDVAAPGFKKEDFNLHVENNVLTISSEKQLEENKEEEEVSRREFMYGAFQRSFTLPTSAEADKINAKYDNGILVINIPKKDESKTKAAKRIDIS